MFSAEKASLNASTFRYYEQIGLIPNPVRQTDSIQHFSFGTLETNGYSAERLGFLRRSRLPGKVRTIVKQLVEKHDFDNSIYNGVYIVHQNEYEWVRQTRRVLLDFCSELEPNDFTRQVDGFGWQSVRDKLVHIADCYNAWLGSFVLSKTKKPLTSKEDLLQLGSDEIKVRFEHVDSFVNEVFGVLAHHRDEPIQREIPWREGETLSITPGKLLLHAITHEFHHKGQIVSMARQMGYEPPNTDVLGTRE